MSKDVKNVPALRFKGYSDAWEKRKLGETNSYFTDGNYGESYPKESELSDKENGVPFLRGSNLRNGELIEDNANYITKEKHAELTSGHLVEDDIVLAVRGSLGALGYVKEENIDWNINSQLAVIRTDKSELSGKFLAQFLLSWRGQKELLSRNTGTALKQLPIKQLKDVPVPIVNLDEQKEISALFTSIDNLIAATQSRLSSLELLKKALLQDLFI
ncbi:restriction endonuclease subunit S [Lacticaseibacillus paracasei]|uniref:restriction endonuclease subunit S n=1 Tax=Lacticaseibacillus paracasei TaxID=1597 RepID=UPI000343A1F9|nr:restriction endonuclease subunit S [Lacticaseibacillus paracasei]EPC87154.1 restriction modification system DNA specificity subunit [Lacticaseibacillus paracasei subsp. paracasei Lpp43]MDB7793367.1 restriction endonuclease subunit S [Lacticaseibacillus paracasei]MDH7450568.1 restriction endonuclease subunit S [Lacticaseibacillus paracasei subsp. paracasei]UUV91353.1 restriction endonuclease subunit S [Lacticaseibacillus paracasei]